MNRTSPRDHGRFADPRARANQVEGVLLGAACGDARGVPYEFGSAQLTAWSAICLRDLARREDGR